MSDVDKSGALTILREPLLHFAVLALALVWLTPAPKAERVIELDSDSVRALEQGFEAKAKRPPTPAERTELINAFLRDELLRRQALAMGLHESDPVVRRRLIQSLEYLAESELPEASPPPTGSSATGALLAELSARPERYQQPEQLSFHHVFVKAGPELESRVQAVAQALEGLSPTPKVSAAEDLSYVEIGDAFLKGRRFASRSRAQVTAAFGPTFASALFELAQKPSAGAGWLGPIESSYGRHFVRVEQYQAARTASLAEARPALEAAVRDSERQARRAAFVARLAAQYRLQVAGEPWSLAP